MVSHFHSSYVSIHFSDCELWNFFFLLPLYYTIIFYINSFVVVVVVRVFVFLYFCFIFSAQVATVWIGLMKNCTFIIIIKSWLVYFIFLVLLRKTFFFFWFQAIYYDFYYYYLSINKIKAFYLFDDFIFLFLCYLQLGKQFFLDSSWGTCWFTKINVFNKIWWIIKSDRENYFQAFKNESWKKEDFSYTVYCLLNFFFFVP